MTADEQLLTDPSVLRPFIIEGSPNIYCERDGEPRLLLQNGPTPRPPLTLRHWRSIDAAVALGVSQGWGVVKQLISHRPMTLVCSELARTNLTHEVMSRTDSPHVEMKSLPLDRTDAEFSLGEEVGRWPKEHDFADLEPVLLAGRRVAATIEGTVLAALQREPSRKVVRGVYANPRGFEYSVARLIDDVAQPANHLGPYGVVLGREWKPSEVAQLDPARVVGLDWVVRSPVLAGRGGMLVQLTPDVVRLVVGLMPLAVRWTDNFRVVASITPQVRGPGAYWWTET